LKLGTLLKIIGLIQQILELAENFDASFERTQDGKLKICVIIDPKIILQKTITENNER